MKNKLLATMAIFGMVASASAVKINNNLSINGFIDGSYKLVDNDTANDQGLDADEAEINFVLSNGPVSGLIAIDSARPRTDDLNIEQAHFTYDLGNGVSFTFGRYGSALGFEREDPAGLYTFSRAYSTAAANLGNIDNGNAVEGVTISYAADQFSLAASFENGRGANLENNDLDLELSLSYTGIADTVIGGGFFFDNEATTAEEVNVVNVHASRSFGKLLLAAEYIQLQSDAIVNGVATGDKDAYLVLADYDYTDKIGVAVRLSKEEVGANNDYEKITIAPNYSFTDNLGAIIEFSDVESNNVDSNEIAVELTYTF
jgi:predicted porin